MEFCHSFGSSVSLACIESPQENDYLKNWLIEYGDHTTGVWVGGSDNGHVGRWAWFPTGQLIKNFNWGPSQPNGGDQHCMYIVGGYLGYQWADFHCGFEMTFLCEYDVNDIEAWRRRRQYRGRTDQNIVQSPTLLKKQDYQQVHQDKYALNIHYGFTNETQNSKQTVPNKITTSHSGASASKKVIDHQNDISDTTVKVTKKPYRNSVVISTMTKSSTTTANRITENDSNNADQNSSDKDDWTVYNFLKSIVKLG